jgi:prepilin-type N-terminal cleavage/methylation domain-containing protein
MKNMSIRLSKRRFSSSTYDNNRGFTLTEILIVVAILGILAGIAVPMYLGHRAKAMHSEAKTNLETIRMLEEQLFSETASFGGDNTYTYNGTYGTDDTGIEDVLPAFRPGNVNNLKFTYTLVIASTGTRFLATATGIAGTPVDGTTFSLDEANNKTY